MIAKYLIQLRQSKLCRKGGCQPPYDVTPLETAMPLGVKGRRSYPLLRLGSYKPMAFWPWVVDRPLSLQKNPFHPACFCPQKNTFRTWNTTSESVLFSEYQVLDTASTQRSLCAALIDSAAKLLHACQVLRFKNPQSSWSGKNDGGPLPAGG